LIIRSLTLTLQIVGPYAATWTLQLNGSLISEKVMTVKNQKATVPSLSQLKAEVQAKRAELKAGGKIDKNSVAMKEVARKYGFTSWEKLHAAALKQPTVASANMSVIVLTVDEGDHALIVNREIVLTSNDIEIEPMLCAGRKLAKILGVKLKQVNASTADIKINGEMLDVSDLTFEAVASALNLTGSAPAPEQDQAALAEGDESPAERLASLYGTDHGWGEHPNYPRADWKYQVENGDTGASYWDFVVSEIESNEDVFPWESEIVVAQTVLDRADIEISRCEPSTPSDKPTWSVFTPDSESPAWTGFTSQDAAALHVYWDLLNRVSDHSLVLSTMIISAPTLRAMTITEQVEYIEQYLQMRII
jgi:hypothetical protein